MPYLKLACKVSISYAKRHMVQPQSDSVEGTPLYTTIAY